MPESSLFAVLSLAAAAALVLILGPVAARLGLVDRPDQELKDHDRETPIVGGIAVFVAFQLALIVAGEFDLWLLVISLGLLLVGLYDDVFGLPPLLRLGAAAIAGVGLAYAVGAEGDPVAAGLVVLLLVVTLNSVNLLDGADGVAGSAALISSLGLVFLALIRDGDPVGPLLLTGAIGGFLVVNWPPARAFLGDGGAYVVGTGLAYYMAKSSTLPADAGGEWLPQVMVAAALLGVFLIDLVVTLLRRTLSRQPLFGGDRSHVYDQLADRGWPAARVAVGVAATQFGLAAIVLVAALTLGSWSAAVVAIFTVHAVVTVLCAMGFAYQQKRQIFAPPV